jgi:hypothetical protein
MNINMRSILWNKSNLLVEHKVQVNNFYLIYALINYYWEKKSFKNISNKLSLLKILIFSDQ